MSFGTEQHQPGQEGGPKVLSRKEVTVAAIDLAEEYRKAAQKAHDEMRATEARLVGELTAKLRDLLVGQERNEVDYVLRTVGSDVGQVPVLDLGAAVRAATPARPKPEPKPAATPSAKAAPAKPATAPPVQGKQGKAA